MLLSIQQRYILDVLRELKCLRRRQLQALVQGKFREIEITDRRMDAMLRQLRAGCGLRLDGEWISLSEIPLNHRRLEAIDVMLELSECRPQDFSARCQSPELLRFALDGASLRLFTVATLSDPLRGAWTARDSPGRMVWISDSGTAPTGLALPPKQFFAARQPDGSHRFYGS